MFGLKHLNAIRFFSSYICFAHFLYDMLRRTKHQKKRQHIYRLSLAVARSYIYLKRYATWDKKQNLEIIDLISWPALPNQDIRI